MAVPKEILQLVEIFERNQGAYTSGAYNETQLRQEFINLLFTLKIITRFLIFLTFWFTSMSLAQNFVPFAIPAQPHPASAIAYSSPPVDTDSPRLAVRSGHFVRGNQRVRLWGVNLSFGANFPQHEDAEKIALRLARAGINSVRFHHMDTADFPRGIWNPQDKKSFDPQALDRLDYFIDQLAQNGIFVDLNLHVGRTHSQPLSLPSAGTDYDKIVTIFTPELIKAQENYARQILSHINKYRKIRYADDPALALVEITNENSLFMWDGDEKLRTLPQFYADILQKQYINWLKNRYETTDKLRTAWAKGILPLGDNLLANSNLQIADSADKLPPSWHLEQHSDCRAVVFAQNYQFQEGLAVKIVNFDGTDWHLQLNQREISLKAGQYYTVAFRAAGDQPRRITCNVGQAHSPWQNLGLQRQLELTPQWQRFQMGFVARADDANARINFAFGGDKSTVYIAEVEFRPGGRAGLNTDESLESGNVALYPQNETSERILDRIYFLAETEKQYFDHMRNFIKQDLGCGGLVTGTIVFGPLGLYGQSDMDFVDSHAYWQHPRFPGRPWDSNNWLVEQKAMTDHPAEATLFRMAAERLAGKPFTVSEYNHPAPNDYQAECVPLLASFAAAQDWDGVWLYTYSHGTDWDQAYFNSYFDIHANPAKWGFIPAGAAIFRHAGIDPLRSVKILNLLNDADPLTVLAPLHLKYDRDMLSIITQQAHIKPEAMLNGQISLGFKSDLQNETPDKMPQLSWIVSEKNHGLFTAQGSGAWAYIGHAEQFHHGTDGQVTVTEPAFAVITVTSLQGKPLSRSTNILITACGRCENVNMKFSADRRTVGRNWGQPPAQIQAVEGTLVLPQGKWTCQSLEPGGTPKQKIPVTYRGGQGILLLSAHHQTMWYLLTQSGI
jgi:hypothetical protein